MIEIELNQQNKSKLSLCKVIQLPVTMIESTIFWRGVLLLNSFKNNHLEVYPIIVPVPSKLKSINFFIVKHGNSLSLIDTGYNSKDCWEALQNTLHHNDLQLDDLTQILLTHHHHDHTGLVDSIVDKHDIPVYAHHHALLRLKREPAFMKMRIDFFKQLYAEMGCGERGEKQIAYLNDSLSRKKDDKLKADVRILNNNSLLHFTIVETPGHAVDQVAFHSPECNWLFAGDLVIDHMSTSAFVEPDFKGTRLKSLAQHIHSLETCSALQSTLLFPGHGTIIDNPTEVIKHKLQRLQTKSTIILSCIQAGITTANDIAEYCYREKYDKQFSNIISEVISHLDDLELQGKIYKQQNKNIWHYYLL
ncbi:MAG: MBL fold metallo-hydrolase [Bacillus sp. (in: firmicutes)]